MGWFLGPDSSWFSTFTDFFGTNHPPTWAVQEQHPNPTIHGAFQGQKIAVVLSNLSPTFQKKLRIFWSIPMIINFPSMSMNFHQFPASKGMGWPKDLFGSSEAGEHLDAEGRPVNFTKPGPRGFWIWILVVSNSWV